MSNTLIVERMGSVVEVTLNRPQQLNALNVEMMTALRRLWPVLRADGTVRCVTLTGAGAGFCSGGDIAMLSDERQGADHSAQDEISFLPGRQLDCPVIVGVNGVCAGGGLQFLADCDIAIASDAATFMDPHVSVGQISGLEPIALLFRARTDAVMRMLMLGREERLNASEAQQVGLVSEVVSHGELQARLRSVAQAICHASPAALRISRRVVRTFLDSLTEQALDEAWAAVTAHWNHPDSKEGPRAFLERRRPSWVEAS